MAVIAQGAANVTGTTAQVELRDHNRRRIRRRHRLRGELNPDRLTCCWAARLDAGGPAQDGREDQGVGRAECEQTAAVDHVAVPGWPLSQPEPEQPSPVVP